ncbi:MAG: hypothetical protein K5696_07575 [Lachnospiraceae bacterium]|nr:hypothetical protein [Lachnospiraceae bacterium]
MNLQRRFYLYTKNLEDQVEDADFLKKLTALSPKCEWSSVMREIRGSEALKHIFVAGLTKLTSEIIEQKSTIKHNPMARKLHTYLQITPQRAKRIL